MTTHERLREIGQILRDRAQTARTENRDFTDAENQEIAALRREQSWLMCEINATDMARSQTQGEPHAGLVEFVRSAANGRSAATLVISREEAGAGAPDMPHMTGNLEAGAGAPDMTHMTGNLGAVQPLTVGEVIHAVEERLIWHLLGIQMPTGLGGSYEWPVVGDVEATFAGEGVEIEPVKLDISKIAAVQQRVAITMALTRESVFNSRGKIQQLVLEAEPKAIAKAINKVVLSPTKIADQNLEGPFVNATKETVPYTFAGLNKAKSKLLEKGYENDGLVWVMSEAVKAELEATPKDAGSGIMMIENDKLCGRPVFTCSALGDQIGLGDFRYQIVGQFGQPDMVVDPISKAKAGKIEITLNANFGTATLAKDAFVLLSRKA